MGNTKEILVKLKNLIEEGRLLPRDMPVNDIKECVSEELELYKNTYTPEQYSEIRKNFVHFCECINEGEHDPIRMRMFIDGMMICLSTVSQAVRSLVNRDYWLYKYRDRADDPEISGIIDYIEKKGELRLINYDFVDAYKAEMYRVYHDNECGLSYVPYKGRKMYFPKGWNDERIQDYFCSVLSEQNVNSPHCYKLTGFEVKPGSVIIDAGAAEGLFSLDYIDTAERVIMIDADDEWIEALNHTFINDMDKVEIICGYVGCLSDGDNKICLDSVLDECKIGYIKMDIEGYEKDALLGAKRILKDTPDMTCAICSYHNKDDEIWIKRFLSERGYETDNSKGYIFPDWEAGSIVNAELRRGIVFGKNN